MADLQRVLMESADVGKRAHAHLELGRHALRHGQFERAIRHFHEALVHDPRLEAARKVLADLGETSEHTPRTARRRRTLVRALLRRVRRR